MFASYVSLPEGNVSKAIVNHPYFDGFYHADKNGKCGDETIVLPTFWLRDYIYILKYELK